MRWLLIAALLGVVEPAAAQPSDSIVATGSLLVGCRALVENYGGGNPMEIGACAGAIRAVIDLGREFRRACAPPGNGVLEAARIVISFVDERPERKAEQFGPMALTALGYKWSC